MKPKFSEDEIKFVSFFLTKDNTPAFKREIKEGTGLSKTTIKDLCDKFEGELLIKSYDYVPKSGYLVHYSLKESFYAFSCIAQNLLPYENFVRSSYTQKCSISLAIQDYSRNWG